MTIPQRGEKRILFRVEGVTKDFGNRERLTGRGDPVVRALDEVSLEVWRGETFGLVGESGSGKTTLGRLLLTFEKPTQGRISFDGAMLDKLSGSALKGFRRQVQMVYQNPFASLNPRRTVNSVLSSGPAIRELPRGQAREKAMADLLERVGLHKSMLGRYPHEFSGGQRQRIVIARALSAGPSVLVADEPVSALDVSIQAQVLDLLRSLKRDLGLSVVMITHDLRVVNFFCDRLGVLYRGRLVELGDRQTIVENSAHPYTRMLMSAAPTGKPSTRRHRPLVRGEAGAGQPAQESCAFASRCWLREQLGRPERCTSERPAALHVADGHVSACHFAAEVGARHAAAFAGDGAAGAVVAGGPGTGQKPS